MTLVNKALLANLSVSQWVGRKYDRNATSTVETTYATQGKVGQYSKKLLPGATELAEIQRQAQDIRVFFYQQTLPWCSDGSRILSSKNYLDFTAAFRDKKSSFDKAVSEFISSYPQLVQEARSKLGNLFHETDYPSQAALAGAFSCEITFMPIPDVGDFRVDILDEEKTAFLNRMHDVEKNATRECWTRLHDMVSNAVVKLQSPDSIFRDSLFENITEICTLLPKLNVTDDAQLESMRQSVETLVAGISPDALRKNSNPEGYQKERDAAARKLEDITSKMSAFMG